MTKEELHMLLFESCEKGDLTSLKTLMDSSVPVDVIVFFYFNSSSAIFTL